ncbi:MAG: hypothetical protein K0R17_542 [Rariglobus sp.]|jgi:hypothetical protein|nr:hypothetical protein [Rariglobus sp.]
MSRPFPLRLLPGLVLLAATPLPAADSPPASSPWDQAALGLFKDAHASFAQQAAAADREARFGEAVTLINLQPKTDTNLDRAASLLTAIAATDATDELGVSSRYYLARIAQIHRASPDNAAALRIYRELAGLSSPHALAQRAVVHVALLELFDPRLAPAEIRPGFDRLAARGATLTDPSALRDFHLVMGDAALRFNLGETIALDHLLAADRAGIVRATTQRDTWVRIAELARRTGRNDVAITYYRHFLDKFLRDSRRLMITERLAALTATQPAEAAR